MIRKLIHIALVFTLLLASAGIGVHKHFCQNRLAKISFISKVSDCCGGKKEMPPGCCHDEFEFHQLEVELTQVEAYSFTPLSFSAPEISDQVLPLLAILDLKEELPIQYYRPPPLPRGRQVLYQSFLI